MATGLTSTTFPLLELLLLVLLLLLVSRDLSASWFLLGKLVASSSNELFILLVEFELKDTFIEEMKFCDLKDELESVCC